MVVAVCINQLVGADNLRLQASGENPIDVLRGVNPQQVFAGDLPLNRVNMPGGDPGLSRGWETAWRRSPKPGCP